MSSLPARHRFDLQEWRHLINSGFFAPQQRAELIEGELIDRAPVGTSHSGCVDWLNYFFSQHLSGQAIVRVQNPIQCGDFSAPQPDLAILRYRPDFYRARNPQAEDVLLIIEVADSTLRYDRQTKAPLYARFGIPEYWLVNLEDSTIEVYRQPGAGAYGEKTVARRGDVLRPVNLEGIAVNVGEVLG
jgi:Uma2 family endonuclease